MVYCVVAVLISGMNDADRMNWTQIQELKDKGWEIASHSVNHCDMVNVCNQSINWTNEFSVSKKYIDGNLTNQNTTSFIYPLNSENSTIQVECAKNYTLCTGSAMGNYGIYNFYKNMNLYGGIKRNGLTNLTTLQMFKDYIWVDDSLVLEYNFNENSGTIAYDSSGNGNHGTISGATWQNDGVLVSLTQDTDYDFNSPMFRLLNPRYDFSNITLTSSFLGHWFVNRL